jgi:hypothetical protein
MVAALQPADGLRADPAVAGRDNALRRGALTRLRFALVAGWHLCRISMARTTVADALRH